MTGWTRPGIVSLPHTTALEWTTRVHRAFEATRPSRRRYGAASLPVAEWMKWTELMVLKLLVEKQRGPWVRTRTMDASRSLGRVASMAPRGLVVLR